MRFPRKSSHLFRALPVLCCFLLFRVPVTVAQATFTNNTYGISMRKPSGWKEVSDSALIKNLARYKFKDQEVAKIIKDHRNSLLLASFYKYDLQEHSGLVPTINVMVRPNDAATDEAFLTQVIQSFDAFKKTFPDFTYTEKPHIVDVDGGKAARFTATFTLTTATGAKRKVRSTNMAIPKSPYFFQLGFIDGPEEGEDTGALFDEIQQTISIKQPADK